MDPSPQNPRYYSAAAVADYIIKHGKGVTNLKLQKMLYFMQGFALVRLRRALFLDDIEAWTFGPVVPSVYHMYKDWGAAPIEQGIPAEKIESQVVRNLLDGLIRTMENFSGADLVGMTHKKGTPWSLVWNDGLGRCNRIPLEMIYQYFANAIPS